MDKFLPCALTKLKSSYQITVSRLLFERFFYRFCNDMSGTGYARLSIKRSIQTSVTHTPCNVWCIPFLRRLPPLTPPVHIRCVTQSSWVLQSCWWSPLYFRCGFVSQCSVCFVSRWCGNHYVFKLIHLVCCTSMWSDFVCLNRISVLSCWLNTIREGKSIFRNTPLVLLLHIIGNHTLGCSKFAAW